MISSRPNPSAEDRLLLLFLFMLLGLLLLAAYSNSFKAPFLLDNKIVIGADPRIRELSKENLVLIFTKDYWYPHIASDLYRPLTTLTYLLNYSLFGNEGRPFGYHVVNFILHWANSWLVFRWLFRLSKRWRFSYVSATLFAIHPVNVESVTNIVGRADLLATLSVLTAGLLCLKARSASRSRRIFFLVLSGSVSLAGAYTKESAVMILPVIVLTDLVFPASGVSPVTSIKTAFAVLRRGWPEYLAVSSALVGVLLTRYLMPQVSTLPSQIFVDNPIAQSSPVSGFMTAIYVIARYVLLLVLPVNLSPDYSYNQIPLYGESGPWWHDLNCWLSFGLISMALFTAWIWRHLRPIYSWGILFFLGTLLPTSNILFPIGSIMAERFLYLPSIGFCVILSLALSALSRGLVSWQVDGVRVLPPVITALLPISVAGGLAVRTHARNADWCNELVFWRSAVAASPESFKTHKGLAGAIYDSHQSEENLDIAIAELETGRRILEQVPLDLRRREATLYVHLGIYLRQKGDFVAARGAHTEAKRYFSRSVSVLKKAREIERFNVSRRLEALRSRGENPSEYGSESLYATLGYSSLQIEAWQDAFESGLTLQAIFPSLSLGYTIAGIAEARQGRLENAIVQLAAGLVLRPNDTDARGAILTSYKALGIVPNPVTIDGDRINFNISEPQAEAHMGAAINLLIENHERAGRSADAGVYRERALAEFKIRPKLIGGGVPVKR